MWIADGWKDYEVLDTSGGEKLERWGDYLLVRPDPQVIWNTKKENPGWKKKNGGGTAFFLPYGAGYFTRTGNYGYRREQKGVRG